MNGAASLFTFSTSGMREKSVRMTAPSGSMGLITVSTSCRGTRRGIPVVTFDSFCVSLWRGVFTLFKVVGEYEDWDEGTMKGLRSAG